MTPLAILLLLFSCNSPSDPPMVSEWREICCRDEGVPSQRKALYRAKVPSCWLCSPIPENLSLSDTTISNCELYIVDGEQSVRIVVHTFPSEDLSKRTPPLANVERWKRQFDQLQINSYSVTSLARGGYEGYYFDGIGRKEGQLSGVLGWSMQLASRYYHALQVQGSLSPFLRQQRQADYTIKAEGPPPLIERYRHEIERFAASFEPIEEFLCR